MMSTDAVEEFGERLVRHVRDEAIQLCDLRLHPDRQSTIAKRWRAAAATIGGEGMVIPDYVDTTAFEVLREIDDQERLHLSFTTKNGETVDLLVEGGGELGGWYLGTPGWRTWYSNERIVDADDIDVSALAAEWGTEHIPDDPAPILEELPMPRRAIEELGQLLVRHVRDVAIQSCDLQLLPHSQTPLAKRWRRAAVPFNGKVPPQVLIPDCVDETILLFSAPSTKASFAFPSLRKAVKPWTL
ncbi:MAG: hypothetical protein IPM54_10845 [Polyangiaceae bacterium]|nr:hypothetical protein [Polyangiaceae bacterium]